MKSKELQKYLTRNFNQNMQDIHRRAQDIRDRQKELDEDRRKLAEDVAHARQCYGPELLNGFVEEYLESTAYSPEMPSPTQKQSEKVQSTLSQKQSTQQEGGSFKDVRPLIEQIVLEYGLSHEAFTNSGIQQECEERGLTVKPNWISAITTRMERDDLVKSLPEKAIDRQGRPSLTVRKLTPKGRAQVQKTTVPEKAQVTEPVPDLEEVSALTDAILGVVASRPKEGLTRGKIKEVLDLSGFNYNPNSLSATLCQLRDRGRLTKKGNNFTLPSN